MTKKELYDNWVERVMSYASSVGGEIDKHIAAMQAKPFFDKQSEIMFMGINPGEKAPYNEDKKDEAKNRFYEGNPFKPEVWGGRWNWAFNPENTGNSFTKAGWADVVTVGNYLFSNLIFFGSPHGGSDIKEQEVISQCVKFSSELITEIFKPKSVICFSVKLVFERLRRELKFENVHRITPITNPDGSNMKFRIMKGKKDGIQFYGIPHLSGARGLSKMDFDTIVRVIKQSMNNKK